MRDLAVGRSHPAKPNWREASRQLLRAGLRGNAMSVDAGSAYRLLTQWNDTRRLGALAVVATGVLVLVASGLLALLFVLAAAVGGPAGFAIGSAGVIAAIAGAVHRVWRVPLAMFLVRYGIVLPWSPAMRP